MLLGWRWIIDRYFRDIWIPEIGPLCQYPLNISAIEEPPQFVKNLTVSCGSAILWNIELLAKL